MRQQHKSSFSFVYWAILCLGILLSVFLMPEMAFSQEPEPTREQVLEEYQGRVDELDARCNGVERRPLPPDQQPANSSVILYGEFEKFPGLTNKIVGCVHELVEGVIDDNLAVINQQMRQIIAALMTLFAMFFTIQFLLGNLRNTIADSIVMILTFMLVGYFSLNAGLSWFLGVFQGAQVALIDVVTGSLNTAITRDGGAVACQLDTIWQRLDCTIFRMIGVKEETAVKIATGQVSFAGMVGAVLGARLFEIILMLIFNFLGPLILLAGLGMVLMMVAAFVEVLFLYISSLLVIVFLGLLGPLIIPLYMFQKTRDIFIYWVQTIFGFTLQPAIVLAYLAFMLHALNYTVGTNGGLYSMIEIASARAGQMSGGNTRILIEGKSRVKSKAQAGAQIDENPETNTASEEGSVVRVGNLRLGDTEAEHKSKLALFFQSISASTLMLALTLGFMVNVMNFGAQLVGLGAAPVSQAINVYNRTVKAIAAAMSRQRKRQ